MTEELIRSPKPPTEVARTEFQEEQRELIRQTIAPDCTQAEFDLFLEIAARHGLNPLTGEIYAAKMPGRNAGGGKFTPIVGKDGFLAIANRHPDFRGVESDVVHEYDSFKKLPDGRIEHTYEMGSGGAMPRPKRPDEEGEPGLVPPEIKKRGKILGAWALVHRMGRTPTYFFAPMAEYDRQMGPWKQYPDAMIRKVAIANALREAFNLSGLYHEAELDKLRQDQAEEVSEWSDDPELAARFEKAVERLNELEPGRWRPARIKLQLAGNSAEEQAAFLQTLEARVVELEEQGEPVDAEVVGEAA